MTELLNLTQETLRVVATASEGRVVVRLTGELDLACSDAVTAVNDLELDGISNVSVDLSELEFIDSTGVQALLQVHTRQGEAGREVSFVHAQAPVRRIFATLGIDHYLTG